MKRRLINTVLFALLFTHGGFLFSQQLNPSFEIPSYKSYIGLNAHYEISSSSISNHFVQQYLKGGYIDSLHKQWMFAGLKKTNYLGADYNGSFIYSFNLDSTKSPTLHFFFKYNYYNHLDISFTNDLAKLYFDGNKQFAGQTAFFNKSSLQILTYDQYQLGFTKKMNHNNNIHTYGVGLGFNNGYNNTIIQFNEASLYTETNASYVNLAANYEVRRRNKDSLDKLFFKGVGASLNIYYSYKSKNNHIFNFQISELGFIQWDYKSQHISKDTLIHFEGVSIPDIFNIENPIFENMNTDSIIQEYTVSDSTQSYIIPTPASIYISYLHSFFEKTKVEISLLKKTHVHFDPLIQLKLQYFPNPKHLVSLNFSYGGYSSLDFASRYQIKTGITYAHLFKNGLLFNIGSDFLNGFLWRYSSTSQGAYISLKKYIF